MTTLNLEDPNVVELTLSVEQARLIEIDNEDVFTAFDNAQGMVFGGDHKKAYLVIEITG